MNSVTGGFEWDIAGDGFMGGWTVDGYYQYGENERKAYQIGLRVDRIFAAVDAVRDPATGNIVCRTTPVRRSVRRLPAVEPVRPRQRLGGSGRLRRRQRARRADHHAARLRRYRLRPRHHRFLHQPGSQGEHHQHDPARRRAVRQRRGLGGLGRGPDHRRFRPVLSGRGNLPDRPRFDQPVVQPCRRPPGAVQHRSGGDRRRPARRQSARLRQHGRHPVFEGVEHPGLDRGGGGVRRDAHPARRRPGPVRLRERSTSPRAGPTIPAAAGSGPTRPASTC